ncbi:MAG: nitroreductase family protein [Tannerella sp.]|jgi:nitroreductase|nr:nitroreductase family protein [Tannerella sp.]
MFKKMKSRRSIRKYADKEISEEVMNELLEIAVRASNTGNMQLYSIVITRDKAQKEKLAPAHFNQPMITEAPVVLTFCADVNRFTKWASFRNADAGFDNFQTFITAAIDTTIAAQTFCVAAEEKGLGICYLGTTTYNAAQIIDVLKLPPLVIPITTITVGYPDGELPEQPERLPIKAIVHKELYKDYALSDIDKLYYEKETLTTNRKFVAENNKETLAQVFTDVRYTRNNNEFFSEQFLNVVKKQLFI